MKGFITIVYMLLGLAIVHGQNRSDLKGAETDPLQNVAEQYRVTADEELLISETFDVLEAALRNKSLADANVFSDDDIKMYVDRYYAHPDVSKDVSYETAYNLIESAAADAAAKLKAIGDAQNVTLMKSKAMYGDPHNISKVIQYRVDIVDQKGSPVLFEVLFVEIGGVYKILSVIDQF